MGKSAPQIQPKPPEMSGAQRRVILENALLSAAPADAFEALLASGQLHDLLPELTALPGVAQPPQYHPEGDVWQHTMIMLEHMVYPDALTAWAVLLHDIGKPATQSVDPDGRIRFFGHEVKGAAMAEEILRRLAFADAEIDIVVSAIRNHMRLGSVAAMKLSKVRQIVRAPHFRVDLELHRLDCISSHHIMTCFDRLLAVYVEDHNTPREPLPWVRGQDLIAVGVKPGPTLGAHLADYFARQKRGEFATPEAARQTAARELGSSSSR